MLIVPIVLRGTGFALSVETIQRISTNERMI